MATSVTTCLNAGTGTRGFLVVVGVVKKKTFKLVLQKIEI